MTEKEIRDGIDLATQSLINDEHATPEAKAVICALLGQIIIDIHRAADALEKLSKKHGASE